MLTGTYIVIVVSALSCITNVTSADTTANPNTGTGSETESISQYHCPVLANEVKGGVSLLGATWIYMEALKQNMDAIKNKPRHNLRLHVQPTDWETLSNHMRDAQERLDGSIVRLETALIDYQAGEKKHSILCIVCPQSNF
jgi:hypothetical protein